MEYASRSLRRRRDTDKWEAALTHKDPCTGESIATYHTIIAKTEAQARKDTAKIIATMLISEGVDIVTVASLLGHTPYLPFAFTATRAHIATRHHSPPHKRHALFR